MCMYVYSRVSQFFSTITHSRLSLFQDIFQIITCQAFKGYRYDIGHLIVLLCSNLIMIKLLGFVGAP